MVSLSCMTSLCQGELSQHAVFGEHTATQSVKWSSDNRRLCHTKICFLELPWW